MSHLVLVESPYRDGDRARNLRYLAWCEFHTASLGEMPIASHGNCTAYWPESEEYRLKGFAWRDRVREVCDRIAYYLDLGLSRGMARACEHDVLHGAILHLRCLPPGLLARFNAGEYPPGSMRRVPVDSCVQEIFLERLSRWHT